MGLSVKVISVGSTYNINTSVSKSVTTGNPITITVPPHKYGNGSHGAYSDYVKGVEEFFNSTCTVTQTSATTTYSPYKVGWSVSVTSS